MKKIIVFALILLAGSAASAQQTLKKANTATAVDGVISAGEYTLQESNGGMVLGLALSADGTTLSVGFRAATKGWVAVGLGAKRMNGASMFMGYDAGGKSEFSEQTGGGHNHEPAAKALAKKSAVKNAGNETTIEFTVPAAPFTKSGKIDMILAFGRNTNLGSMHQYFNGFTVNLAP